MSAERGSQQDEGTVDGVGEPAEERTIIEVPPPIDPELVERMHELEEEIAEDERAIEGPPEL